TAHRRELLHLRLADSRRLRLTLAETLSGHAHDRVGHVHVPVHGDVGDVDVGGAVDDDVVDDARPTPTSPPGDADEAGTSPPRDERLAPAERRPIERTSHGDGDAATEKNDERGGVGRTDDNGPRRPRPVAAEKYPAAVVIRRPAPRRL